MTATDNTTQKCSVSGHIILGATSPTRSSRFRPFSAKLYQSRYHLKEKSCPTKPKRSEDNDLPRSTPSLAPAKRWKRNTGKFGTPSNWRLISRLLASSPPFVVVRRKSDGVKGSLEFQHNPRYYFSFSPDQR